MFGFTKNQQKAYDLLQSGRNLFLTGDAGTGKSYVLSKFIEQNKHRNVLICAPSGIAAINVGGVTIHRAFEVPLHPIPQFTTVPEALESAHIVIIDEISMCRMDVFDYVAECIFKSMEIYEKNIQVVLVGDFYQLPPVLKEDERQYMNLEYGYDVENAFAFQSKYWGKFNFEKVKLNEIVRQSDVAFVNALNQARVGDARCLDYIRKKSSKKRIKKAITICSTNKTAQNINKMRLQEIKKKSRIYKSIIDGKITDQDKATDDILEIKETARVVMLLNDKDNRWQNGSLGTVVDFDSENITIELDNGRTAVVSRHVWKVEKYVTKEYSIDGKKKYKLEKEVIGTFTQFPIKLAYAITMHKSQGQTYDAVNLYPSAWAHGQLYVALSRVKSIDKLYLEDELLDKYLVTAPEVSLFFGKEENAVVKNIEENKEMSQKENKKVKVCDKKKDKVDSKKCPECGAELVERVTHKGDLFYGCTRYPDCRYVTRILKEEKVKLKKEASNKNVFDELLDQLNKLY